MAGELDRFLARRYIRARTDHAKAVRLRPSGNSPALPPRPARIIASHCHSPEFSRHRPPDRAGIFRWDAFGPDLTAPRIPQRPICQAGFRDLGFSWLPATSLAEVSTAAGPGLRLCSSSSRRSADMWVLFVKLFSPAPWWLEPKAHGSGYARSSSSARPGTVPPAASYPSRSRPAEASVPGTLDRNTRDVPLRGLTRPFSSGEWSPGPGRGRAQSLGRGVHQFDRPERPVPWNPFLRFAQSKLEGGNPVHCRFDPVSLNWIQGRSDPRCASCRRHSGFPPPNPRTPSDQVSAAPRHQEYPDVGEPLGDG